MDKLAKELRDIEKALGGDETLPDSYYKAEDKLGWHLDYIEDLIEEGGSGTQTVFKEYMHKITIDGKILGSTDSVGADILLKTKRSEPFTIDDIKNSALTYNSTNPRYMHDYVVLQLEVRMPQTTTSGAPQHTICAFLAGNKKLWYAIGYWGFDQNNAWTYGILTLGFTDLTITDEVTEV